MVGAHQLSKRIRYFLLAAGLLVVALCLALLAVSIGPFAIPFANVFAPDTAQEQAIIVSVRLPRIAMAFIVGGGLALSGATIQAVFRNPIAEPGLLGISLGAALGAVVAIASGFSVLFAFSVPIAAVIGAGSTIALVYLLTSFSRGNPLYTLLLMGLAMSSLISALVWLIVTSFTDLFEQRQILSWLAGGLDTINWGDFRLALIPILVGCVIMLYFARVLNLLSLGDDEASTLGLNVNRARWFAILGATITTGVAVAFTGTIGFVGLIVPHAIRLVVGHDNRLVLPLSIICGGIFLLAADTIARTVIAPVEIRVGIVTAIVGTPIFIFLLLRSRLNYV